MTTTTSRKVLVATSLAFCVLLGLSRSAQATLVGYWKLNENPAATTVVADSSGNAFHGTRFGTVDNASGAFADAGGAFNFDAIVTPSGNREFVRLPNTTTLNNLQVNNYTIMAWVRPDALPLNNLANNENSSAGLVIKNGNHTGLRYSSTGAFRMDHWLTGNVNTGVTSITTHAPGEWYHLAGVVSRTTGQTQLYVNGVLQGTATFTPNTAAHNYGTEYWRIATARGEINTGNFTWPFDGQIDDVLMFNTALNLADIGPVAFLGKYAEADYDDVQTFLDFHDNGSLGDSLEFKGKTFYLESLGAFADFDGLEVGQGYVNSGGFLFINLGGGLGLTTMTVAPEPASFGLLSALSLGLIKLRRRKVRTPS